MMTSVARRRQCIVYALVAFVSFNVTAIVVILRHTPTSDVTSRRAAGDNVVEPGLLPDTQQQQQQHLPAAAATAAAARHNFRLPNRLITEYDVSIAERVTSLAARKAPSRDPELLRLVLDVIDSPPSNKAGYKMFKVDKTPQVTEVQQILNDMNDGFFVECGGLDGERLSNTAYLEREHGWKGLLVEMDPFFYTQLLGKNRRVYSINACLSPYNYFTTLPYAGDSRGRGQLIVDPADRRVRSMHSDRQKVVPCFPLETILTALNRTAVNYMSLDVEGFELPILRSIDWQHIDIQVLSVEFNRGKDKNSYSEYMESQGFITLKEVHSSSFYAHDFIFVARQVYDSMDKQQQQQQQRRRQPANRQRQGPGRPAGAAGAADADGDDGAEADERQEVDLF